MSQLIELKYTTERDEDVNGQPWCPLLADPDFGHMLHVDQLSGDRDGNDYTYVLEFEGPLLRQVPARKFGQIVRKSAEDLEQLDAYEDVEARLVS